MAAVGTTGDDSSPGTGETLGSAPEEPLPMITMTTCPFRLNDEVLKHYQLTKEIGRGAFGSVWEAQDREKPDRKVAVKKMLITDGEQAEAFENEAKTMMKLHHKNICRLFEVYRKGRLMSFIMELCPGKDVFDAMHEQEEHTFGEAKVADIIKQASSALCYAHENRVAHRDIKPENMVFVNQDPSCTWIKLIDWGLAFHFGNRRLKTVVGTPGYCAPEVLQSGTFFNSSYSQACDIWSLGITTYVMLCGKMPFFGAQWQQAKMMKKEQFPMQDATWQAISPEAKDFVKSLLRFDPKKRAPFDKVLKHPWFTVHRQISEISAQAAQQVLRNMQNFSQLGHFHSICVAAVARQLDSHNLNDVHRIFCNLDRDGNGVLTLQEVKDGFESILHPDSEELKQLERIFAELDMDGNGYIDYTEFCAAGVGERVVLEDSALWAAFDSFDAGHHDGQITLDEIARVLADANVQQVWSKEQLEEAAKKALDKFDKDKNGSITFEEFSDFMRAETKARRKARARRSSLLGDMSEETEKIEEELADVTDVSIKNQGKVYDLVDQMNPERKSWRKWLWNTITCSLGGRVGVPTSLPSAPADVDDFAAQPRI
ncbi:Calcium-dependent protein kinase 5 (PbCDPK5) [Durusdinium trenchii]|uniref:Calcium-dependent protein kinase 5 (PbCDPK5) n=1 Tax=Durusdinium trenchii TaxID=1381693 RepID=A0ABP0P971_9DINO